MQRVSRKLGPMNFVGLAARTNNRDEIQPDKGKIGPLVDYYFHNQIANHIQHRIEPGITYAGYTDYESDEHGDYTYFIGEAVSSLNDQDEDQFRLFAIPESQYQIFTTDAGKMPELMINAWQEIWSMDESEMAGKRAYHCDFERYDERAIDPNNSVVDIYIGMK